MPNLDTNKEAGFTRTLEDSSVDSHSERGFTLLMAVIITSVVMMLGVTIAGILQRDALISASSQDSTEAFYAADTALECIMYYDRAQDAFGTSSNPSSVESTVECLGIDAENARLFGNTSSYPYEYRFVLDSETICVGAYVQKQEIASNVVRTFVEARGRNTCRDTDRRSERALKTGY